MDKARIFDNHLTPQPVPRIYALRIWACGWTNQAKVCLVGDLLLRGACRFCDLEELGADSQVVNPTSSNRTARTSLGGFQ
jgi:hypothetical protein